MPSERSQTLAYHYDPTWRLDKITEYYDGPDNVRDGAKKITSFGYDNIDRVRTVTDCELETVTYAYDDLDRPTRITYMDGTYEQFDYERLDLVRTWDRSGHRTQITYDELARPTSVLDRLNRLTQLSWCSCGGLESITDSLGNVTRWVRDLQGRVTEEYYADTDQRHYKYSYYGYTDPSGLQVGSGCLASVQDCKDQVKKFTYFADGTLKSIGYFTLAGDPIPSTPAISFTNDPAYQRVTSMTDGIGLTSFAYKPVGTLGAGELYTVDGPLSKDVITYGYDELGRCNSRVVNGQSESVLFDKLGRITNRVVAALSLNYFPEYVHATPRPQSVSYPTGPNALTTTFGYFDGLQNQRLASINHAIAGGAAISQFDYNYDVLGRVSNWSQLKDGGPRTWHQLEYDLEGQLLNDTLNPDLQPANLSYTYAYDGMGNRTSEQIDSTSGTASSTVTKYLYPNPNRVNQLVGLSGNGPLPVRFTGVVTEPAASVMVNNQPVTIAYDFKHFSATVSLPIGSQTVSVSAADYGAGTGNTTTKNATLMVSGGTTKSLTYDFNGNCKTSGDLTYEWDAEDRLVSIVNGTWRCDFTYDGFGRLARMVENNDPNTTRRFIWSGLELCQEQNGNNAITKAFYPEGQTVNSQRYYYTRDLLGSVREMVDSSGSVRARYDYDSFGRRTKLSGAVDSDFGFAGYFVFSSSHAPNLNVAVYRVYDADTGRWLSRDPIGEVGGLNLYAYVGNSPLDLVDPNGMLSVPPGTSRVAARIGARVAARAAGASGAIEVPPIAAALVLGGLLADGIEVGSMVLYPEPGSAPLPVPGIRLRGPPGNHPKPPTGTAPCPDPNDPEQARRRAVERAWQMERQLISATGRGTRDWTDGEKAELLATGRVSGYQGHHINSVGANPQQAGDPNNIQFLKFQEHLDVHGGNWSNPTWGESIFR